MKKQKISGTEADSSGKHKVNYTEYYKYNKNGWLVSCSYADGQTSTPLKFKYYKNGMPKKITADVYGVEYVFSYSNNGLLKARTFKITEGISSGTAGHTYYSYSFDKKGRVKTAEEKQLVDGKYKVITRTKYEYGKARTKDKRVYFGVMNRKTAAAGSCEDVISREMCTDGY